MNNENNMNELNSTNGANSMNGSNSMNMANSITNSYLQATALRNALTTNLDFKPFFNMINTPFKADISTSCLCQSKQFCDILSRLNYAAENKQFAILTGSVGVGKSTVLRTLCDILDPNCYEVLYVSQSNLSPRWLYAIPLAQMGIDAHYYVNDAKKQFHNALANLTNIKHKQIVMIVDEAHLINKRTLQEIRFLLNEKFDSGNPLCLIVSGQNELWKNLEKEENRAITQRIDLMCKLSALSEDQVASYIAAHLKYAQAAERIFSNDAIAEIAKQSRGVPRMINKICSHSLLYSAAQKASIVTKEIVKLAIEQEIPKCALM